ncbi:glutathione S-transferase family protein [Salinarimonas ramus]|uniref:Glutathione S-transferase n=1 Tax=Salinarimonas ramus TaxID=690164 RepID=A0A917Q4P4_9HYPH|nr:glutathione S-transferase family protein [Salinarimonas ramus]GGK22200.1 glutathione S-transferase [Salinarimonas ramus]
MKLVIGNKLYSSWSLRPWILMRHYGLAFEEALVPLDRPDTKARILAHSPAGKVPVLIDGEATVWESLAILDHLADRHPDLPIWPRDVAARAHARAIAAEMHAGFQRLRAALPMNLGKSYAHVDRGEGVAADVARVVAIWRDARSRFGAGGPYLFGADFGAADAMYAPVVTRLDTYSWPVDPDIRAYMDAVLALPAFVEWREAALEEEWVLAHDEVDEEPIAVYRRRGV